MKHDPKDITLASVVTYLTVQVSGLLYGICLISFWLGFPDLADTATFLGIGFIITVVPTLVFATLFGVSVKCLLKRGLGARVLYLMAPLLAIVIWIITKLILDRSFPPNLGAIRDSLVMIMPPAFIGAAAMHFTLWKQTTRAQQAN